MSEIKYLTHREAAQARLNGEALMWKGREADYAGVNLSIHSIDTQSGYYRAPRVFTHPGGTCPAPETEAPSRNATYWTPDLFEDDFVYSHEWERDSFDLKKLRLGLVYLTREAAIARAELMLAGVAK